MQPNYDLDDSEIPIPIDNDLQQRIHDIFMAHDSIGNKTVDAETLGIIIRSLGLFPSNAEVAVIVNKTQKKDEPGVIHLVDFLPYIEEEINQGKFKPKSLEEILQAFRTLDQDNYGFLDKEQLSAFMTKYAEPFDEDEMAEMLEMSFNNFTKKIHYEEIVKKLKYQPKGEKDIFVLAERVKRERPQPVEEKKRTISQMFSVNQ
ncbi:hypothetical protein WA026_020467 [Henosepilachna vigintioctopunctata]|uniref:EF-hand domain-containing protein n=1 Tax=Henosepilachna vigintioctopunctata TaxID=420089 RepID=A0AAW1VGJ5_9CUCU